MPAAAEAEAEEGAATSDVGGGADISVGCFGWREGEKTACEIRMAAPPEEFFQGLEKYFANDLEGAKKALTGDDLFSKSLLSLVDVKADDGSKNDEIQARIDGMDFKGNDIALMFCVLAQEYGMHMTKGHNLLLKRFGKEEKVIGTEPEEEMPELEDATPEESNANAKANAKPEESKANAKSDAKPAESKTNAKPEESKANAKPDAKPEESKANAKPATTPKQAGGKRKTRKVTSSLLPKRRLSRGKA